MDTTVAALAGGIVGAVATGMVTYILDTGRRCLRVKSLCLGLATELETLWSLHMRNCGTALMQVTAGNYFNGYYSIQGDYFVNYHANADDLGELRNAELRAKIVEIYCELKSLIDSFKTYNEMTSGRLRPQPPQALIDYTLVLPSSNKKLNDTIPVLAKELRNEADFL